PGLLEALLDLGELGDIGRPGVLGRELGGQRLERGADDPDLEIARQVERRHRDEPAGPDLEALLADQPEAGLADRRDAGAQPLGKVLHDDALVRPEAAGDQRLAQRGVGARREVALLERLDLHAITSRATASMPGASRR